MATCTVIGADIPSQIGSTEKQKIDITVNFGIFFDGTQNHRLQVALGKINRAKKGGVQIEEKEQKEIESFAWDDASGERRKGETIQGVLERQSGRIGGMSRADMQGFDYTNIARLEPLYDYSPKTDNTFTYRIYVTGSGTFANIKKGKDYTGLSTGQHNAGVVQKVKDALDAISYELNKIKNNSDIQYVDYKFNVFGFSRGATEARLFVDLCSPVRAYNRGDLLESIITDYNRKYGLSSYLSGKHLIFPKQLSIEFPFVGLFDTVSSVGIIESGIWNPSMGKALRTVERITPSASDFHERNKADLGLDSLVYDDNVKHIVHICALDEYRENFALQVLPFSNSKVEQFFIPGIHTDIGGGDLGGYNEEKYIAKTHNGKDLFLPKIVTPGKTQETTALVAINKENLKTFGWIKDSSDNSMMGDIVKDQDGVIIIQRYSKHGYCYLPLTILAKKACENTCKFENLEDKYSIPGDLPQGFDAMKTAWAGADSKFGHCYFPKEDSKYKLLRQSYLHFSSNIKKTAVVIVDGPNLTESVPGSTSNSNNPVIYYDRFLDYHPKGWYGKKTNFGLEDIVFEQSGNSNPNEYIGEAVVVFESTYTTFQDVNGFLHYRYNDYREDQCNAKVSIRGINGETITKTGATMPHKLSNGISYSNPELNDNPKNLNILKEGFYHAIRFPMSTSKYRESKTYLILTEESYLEYLSNREKLNRKLPGKLPGSLGNSNMKDIFLHRTNMDTSGRKLRVDETTASSGCLVISGNDWGEVENQLGESEAIFIYLKRIVDPSQQTNQPSTT